VLMPDHWHGIIQLGEAGSLDGCILRFKSATARRLNECVGRSGAVWARSFHDRALRREEDLVDMARYVVANPVRAGLVKRVMDYPFWDACWLP
jgi:putative transposase